MLSIGKFPTNVRHNVLLCNPKFPSKSRLPIWSRLYLNGAVLGKRQKGFYCAGKKKGEFRAAEMDGPDEFEDGFDDGVEETDDEVVIPLQNMKEWLRNKPRGFGEGKVYDTSIEDKLTEEIEQSRKSQLANVNKLKDSSVKRRTKNDTSNRDKGLTDAQSGFRVRLTNLPKKKNVHRDLRLAFDGVPGIVRVTPVVSGNEKTRDPVCKGLAFVDFKHQEEAHWFMQNFSGRNISFGKVQRQIKCELVNARMLNSASDDQSTNVAKGIPPQADLNLDQDSAATETSISQLDLWEETDPSNLDDDEDDVEINGTSTASDSDRSPVDLRTAKQGRKLKANDKRAEAQRRKNKIPKLSIISGSAKGLKIREKSVLTGVFSKYGANAAAKQQNR